MRKILIAINLLVLVLLISSCEDILNPHNETHHTLIKFHKILIDQEHSVIMPLKVGNCWVYKITTFDQDGGKLSTYIDSSYVIKDTTVNGEKAFYTRYPFLYSYELGFLSTWFSNTDMGLYKVSFVCGCTSRLIAEYPVYYQTYLYENYESSMVYQDFSGPGGSLVQYTEVRNDSVWITVKNIDSYASSYGVFDSYKYTTSIESILINRYKIKTNQYKYDYFAEYFVPNLGLVRKEKLNSKKDGTMYIETLCELQRTNVKI